MALGKIGGASDAAAQVKIQQLDSKAKNTEKTASQAAPTAQAAPANKTEETGKAKEANFNKGAANALNKSEKTEVGKAIQEIGKGFKEAINDIKDIFKDKNKDIAKSEPNAATATQKNKLTQESTAKNDSVGQTQNKENKSAVSANTQVTEKKAVEGSNKDVTTDAKKSVQNVTQNLQQVAPPPVAPAASTDVAAPKEVSNEKNAQLGNVQAATKPGSVEDNQQKQELAKFDPSKLKANLAALEQAKAQAPEAAPNLA